jgi:hypothetical protein
MTEFIELLILVGLAVILLFVVAAPIILAIGLVGLALKLAVFLILLPIRILGWGIGIGFAALGLLLKGVLLTGAVALLILVGLLPALPLILLGLLIYFLVRSPSPRSSRAGAA